MTAAALRWKRISKVRAVQRQIAEVQLNHCETELRNLLDLGARIAAIRDGAQPSAGAHNGLLLASTCELSARLDTAQRALANPHQSATQARTRQQRTVTAAKQREAAVEKLAAATSAQAAKRTDERQSRISIIRKRAKSGGMI